MLSLSQNTVNVEIAAQYISRRALDARKYDVSEKINYNSTNKINCYLCEYLITQKCLLKGLMLKNLAAQIYLSLQ